MVDFHQVMISNLMVSLGKYTNAELNVDLLRHMVLNTIRANYKKFKSQFGELIICSDGMGKIWRKNVYPYYKANRKRARDESEIDWDLVYNAINTIRDEIKENFSYRVLVNENCEADDIIATLCEHFGDDGFLTGSEPILILSRDKDFIQLHKYPNVKQYSPIDKRFITHPKPTAFLKEQIIRGDEGDGVPNIKSPDDVFVTKSRQKQIFTKNIPNWIECDPKDFCDEKMLRNYKRNEQLIDLSFVPDVYKKAIVDDFESQANKSRRVYNYFVEKRLRNLTELVNDFI